MMQSAHRILDRPHPRCSTSCQTDAKVSESEGSQSDMKQTESNQTEAKKSAVLRTEPVLGSPLSISAVVLASLAVITALYVGKEVILPVMLAVVLKLLLQPIMDLLRYRLHLPAPLAACILIVCLFFGIATVVFTISGPASGWVAKAPEILPVL